MQRASLVSLGLCSMIKKRRLLSVRSDPWIEPLYFSLFLSFGASKLQRRPAFLDMVSRAQ